MIYFEIVYWIYYTSDAPFILFYFLFTIKLVISQENPPNIILMIGDGMINQISSGMYANETKQH